LSRKRPTARDIESRRFWRAALHRFEEAEFLLKNGYATAAVYLAGYAVECGLKALLLRETPTRRQEVLLEGFRGRQGHDLDGLRRRYRAHAPIPEDVNRRLVFVNSWSTDLRYSPGNIDRRDAEDFAAAVREVIEWAKGRF
jgi:HEPN domain-containing protein